MSRRLSLSDAALRAADARFPWLSRLLLVSLTGSLGSVFEDRRPLYVLFSRVYAQGTGAGLDLAEIFKLPRDAADELVLAAVLAPTAESDLTVPAAPRLYATDASPWRGAIVSAPVSESLSQDLWHGSERRGSYVKLDSRARCKLRRLGCLPRDLEDEACDPSVAVSSTPGPSRQVAQAYDFLEVGSGSDGPWVPL